MGQMGFKLEKKSNKKISSFSSFLAIKKIQEEIPPCDLLMYCGVGIC